MPSGQSLNYKKKAVLSCKPLGNVLREKALEAKLLGDREAIRLCVLGIWANASTQKQAQGAFQSYNDWVFQGL